MSTSPHAPAHPHQHPAEQSTTDWTEAIAVGLAALIAIVIVAGILALLIII